jgi:hypothetical protein
VGIIAKSKKEIAKGGEVTRHNVVRVTLDDIEARQLAQIKQHYGFEKEADVFRALIKRASLSLPVKGVRV